VGPVGCKWNWDPTAPLTPHGQLPFFIEYLRKAAGLFDALVADCSLVYASPNAPDNRGVLGTTMLSVLAGHKRYAHIMALQLLGIKEIVSEDAVRRGFKAIGGDEGQEWLQLPTPPRLARPGLAQGSANLHVRDRTAKSLKIRSSGRWSSSTCRLASPPCQRSGKMLTANQRQRIQSDRKDASGYCSAQSGRERQRRAGFDRRDHARYDFLSQSGLRCCANIDDTRLADNGTRSGEAQPHRNFDDLRRVRSGRLPALRNTLSDLSRQVDRWRILIRACYAIFARSNKTTA
jgi:hypothetical protein